MSSSAFHRGPVFITLVSLLGCSDYRRGEACETDGDTLVIEASYGFEVETTRQCRVRTDDLSLTLDVQYWCEWTNVSDEGDLTSHSCTSTAMQWIRVGETTCYVYEVKCTDYPPLVDDDPVHNSSEESATFCRQAEDLPLCD